MFKLYCLDEGSIKYTLNSGYFKLIFLVVVSIISDCLQNTCMTLDIPIAFSEECWQFHSEYSCYVINGTIEM